MKTSKLQIEQLSNKLKPYQTLNKTPKPSIGWVKTVRISLGMTQEQLGNKLDTTRQAIQQLEKREAEGAITIRNLEEVATALDMSLVYAFIPKDGTVEQLIERKAKQLAMEIVLRTSGSMQLEDQENSPERIKAAIEERTNEILNQLPKALWD